VASHAALPEACATVALAARERYTEAQSMLAAMTADDRASLRPAVVMMTVYDRLLVRLVANRWQRPEKRIKVPRVEKMWIALRHGVM
jgi:phytoene/squalene synthetase